MMLWLTIAIIGLLTFATRLSFILTLGKVRVPERVERALRFVPIAVLSALILPALVLRDGVLWLVPGNARLIAGACAIVVAATTRNAILTIVVGMGVLWIVQALVH